MLFDAHGKKQPDLVSEGSGGNLISIVLGHPYHYNSLGNKTPGTFSNFRSRDLGELKYSKICC